MIDLSKLKKFCTDNNLTADQISELFDVIKEIQSDTIDECQNIIKWQGVKPK